jgi:hypothetical protein
MKVQNSIAFVTGVCATDAGGLFGHEIRRLELYQRTELREKGTQVLALSDSWTLT